MIIFPIQARVLEPELLDSLPPSDPGAIRSRKDLARLDVVMRNSRWILDNLPSDALRTVEIGAGDGRLASRMTVGSRTVTALDLAPPPPGLPGSLQWKQGNFFETLVSIPSEVVVGSLILHHFELHELAVLGARLKERKFLLFVEPLRTWETLVAAYCALPFVGRVTRHDMIVSIRAGFLPGEIQAGLGLGPEWNISETTGLAGSLRFAAWRN